MMRWVAGLFLFINLILPNLTSTDLVGHAVTFWAKERRLLVIDALLFVVFFAILVARQARSPVVLHKVGMKPTPRRHDGSRRPGYEAP